MHVTLSLGLRYPFVAYKDGARLPVPEETTAESFPTAMSVDYVRVWRKKEAQGPAPKKKAATDKTKKEYIAMEKAKWAEKGWKWNQAKVEANFDEMDTDRDGLASGRERQVWYANKSASMK